VDGLVFVSFFSTLFIYCNHGRIAWLPFKSDSGQNATNKYSFYKQLTFIAMAGILISAFFCTVKEIIILIPLGLVSVLYTGAIISRNKMVLKLREVPFLKIFLIAFVWSCATVLLPAINLGQPILSQEVLTLLLRRMLFIFAITVPFDIRDLKADASARIKTLPTVFGLDTARSMAIAAMLIFAALVIYQYFISEQNILLCVAFLISAVVSIWLIKKPAGENKRWHYYIGLDGMMLLQFLLVLGASYI
jgi:4-hydroxybenzoate polyprenyltransferase